MAALHHLALRTHDVERLLAFYRRWFSLEIQHDARPRSVWLRLDAHSVLMLERAEPGEPPIPSGSRELLALVMPPSERARLRRELFDAGLLDGETEHTLYFRDPDGRRVGLSSHPLF